MNFKSIIAIDDPKKEFYTCFLYKKENWRGKIKKKYKNNRTLILINAQDSVALRTLINFVLRQIIAFEKIDKIFS